MNRADKIRVAIRRRDAAMLRKMATEAPEPQRAFLTLLAEIVSRQPQDLKTPKKNPT